MWACGRFWESELNLYSLTAQSSTPPWSDMPHPAHCARARSHAHTYTNIQADPHHCSHQSFASILAVQHCDVMQTDLVEGDFRCRQWFHPVFTSSCFVQTNTSAYLHADKRTFVVLVSQVLLNKVSQDPRSLAVLMPFVHMMSSSTATQHCSCTVLSAGKNTQENGFY